MTRSRVIGAILAALVAGGAATAFAIAWRPAFAAIDPPQPQSFDAARVKRGRELAAIGNCSTCHTSAGGKDFAGGVPVPTPFGTIYSSNITPDPETGIGKWTDRQIFAAVREGRRPDGTLIGPAMPSRSYRYLADEDVEAIVAYLRTVPPVYNPITVKSHYDEPLPASWGPPVGRVAAPPKEDKVAYGAYFAGPLARCMDCHTERHPGEPTRFGAGGKPFYGPWGISVSANLTPDETSGLGGWSDAEIERAIRTGVARDGHKLFPPMPFAAYQNLDDDDMAALIAYLRSLPAVE
jgi:mono/diheme cytochrome c family protein